jgi:hypothetical protein
MSTLAYGTHPYGTRTAPVAPRLRITPRGRAVLAALIAAPLLVVAWVGFSPAAQAGDTPASVAFSYVSVEPGQSLWQLAERIAPGADPREVVADLLSLNNLASADVQPGQRLAVPAEYAG